MLTLIKRILGMIGFGYCTTCGNKLVYKYTHGYDEFEVWDCPHCDYLERFNVENLEKNK